MSKYRSYTIRKRHFSVTTVVAFLAGVLALQCSTNSNPNKPIKSEKKPLLTLEFAKNFSVYEWNNDTIVEVTDGKEIWRKKITKQNSAEEIPFPVSSVSCLSTSHLYFFSEINGLSKVQAVSFAENLKDEVVKAQVDNGNIRNLSHGNSEYDAELVVELQPDVFTTYPFGDDEFERIEQAGIPTLHFTEYLEKHPLGRAEWIKLSGFLLNEGAAAEHYFNKIKESYMLTKLKSLTKKVEIPTVLNANGYANKWTAPNGSSLVAHFIKDAGGKYVFENDTSSGNLNLDFERVYELANSTDYWASVIFADSITLETFLGDEVRLSETKVIASNSIFYCNAQTRDYFGKGIVEPHLILEDLYQIFYQDSVHYEPHYFERFKP